MFLDFKQLEPKNRYKLITASIVPRPIALVTTRNIDGSINAAPFSFFNVFSEDPPLVVLGLQTKPDKSLKDTTTNIRNNGEFVVNLVDDNMVEKMVACAADYPTGESEPLHADLNLSKSKKIKVDYITDSPFSFECKRITVLQFSETRDLAIGEILGMHAKNNLIDKNNFHINWNKYYPIGRLFASHYIYTDKTFSLRIPPAKK
jgi:flavin reductase (DIM6/NTAB) family NADH-FMN oxidoreductase RutF